MFLLQFISVPLGNIIAKSDIKKAENYCEKIIPQLEGYRKLNGSYPNDLSSVTIENKNLPRLLRGSEFYFSDGKSYYFMFPNPLEYCGECVFTSSNKKWWH